ncbi:hypothetical protein CDD81_7985 [Ophiocordyceps australis]|uniref:ABC transporter domain-containing protein n=1 Tax=Ophiocordyceps australis TaxID=1399860 RepID=A0A2C5Y497_9HYPO|nr:hypothetical protein CDD81_7985 [Ophiocordyceps australis]
MSSMRGGASSSDSINGYWGDGIEGGAVKQREAQQEFEELQRQLSRRSTQSRSRRRSSGILSFLHSRQGEGVEDVESGEGGEGVSSVEGGEGADEGGGDETEVDSESAHPDGFKLRDFVQSGQLEKRDAKTGEATKRTGVVWKHLRVTGVDSGATQVRTLPQAIAGTFGPDLYRLVARGRGRGRAKQRRTLLHDFTGVVRPGEMMLVLGRPGSGCSTFLKAVANRREGFVSVEGEVAYGGMAAAHMDKHFKGEVVYNGEEDRHMASLTVEQTLRFSLLTKTASHERGTVQLVVEALLSMFGMRHTRHTLVGDEFTRGVSGGERKRVSIAEALATKGAVACWDNSTRGLDASTALSYAKSLRIMTDLSHRTTLTTLYQAGEGIYRLMDKVLVIDQGRMLFQGPAAAAKQYFVDLGFYCPPRQTTADFLTALCDVNARQFRPGFEHRCPKTPAQLEQAFFQSHAYARVLRDLADYERHLGQSGHADARVFEQAVRGAKSRTVRKRSVYTVSLWKQVLACTRRELWLLWGDKTALYTKFFIIVSNALIVGSLFYKSPSNTHGLFVRGGVVFFSILFLGWLQLSELIKAVAGRAVIVRQKEYAFYRPSAVSMARVLGDLPLVAVEVVVFGLIMYMMTNLDLHAAKFFIYLLFVYATTICLTALYRMFASLSPTMDDAVRFSGISLNLLIIFTGYTIAKPVLLGQKIWFGWLYYVNPMSYAFEAVLTNEFAGRRLQCAPSQIVPQGPGIGPQNQACAVVGARAGSLDVLGSDYLSQQFEYTRSHLWRNFGVVVAFAALYMVVTVWAMETFSFASSGVGALVFKSSAKQGSDEEKGSAAQHHGQQTPDEVLESLEASKSLFTWTDVSYSVPTGHGRQTLLNSVNGYAKPGVLLALMGASGAGKTTLLNTLSQRQTVGVVGGEMLVDGRRLDSDFQRRTGYVEQMDLHEGSATVREALVFSALLRQGRHVARRDKLDYVDKIVHLLELGPVQDAIVASLGVEHRKRLTIGVELAAKPSLLLFLDEPTSGLDSQSAFSIVRFLRKLCAAGQAIVCTIHQPSSELIEQFDQILALNPGGNVFYFGPVGRNGQAVVDYFAARGAVCPPGKNVAEFLLETGAKSQDRQHWNSQWAQSHEKRLVLHDIEAMKRQRSSRVDQQPPVEHHEFAAPVWLQIALLTRRMFVNQWRQPSYVYGKLFTAVIVGIFNGFTFWQLGESVADMQSRMFTLFLIVLIPPTVLNAVLPKFYMDRALWEGREHASRIYGWVAFCTASILSEIPASFVAGLVYWLLWYWPTGLPATSSTSAYVFIMTVLFFLFQSSWGQWICAWAPSFTVISNVLPFFLVVFSLFNGIIVPYSQLNVFWKYWLYWLNPSTYWMGGVLAATLAKQSVVCAANEAAHFEPPAGQNCSSFASDFVARAGRGYLVNPDATADCMYCPFANGIEYLDSLNVKPSQKWRDFGIFLAFCFSNWMLVYFFIYTVRVKRWSPFSLVAKAKFW